MAASSWLVRHCPALVLLSVWVSLNIYLFTTTFNTYQTDPSYAYLFYLLGSGLCIARASALCILLSCLLVVLPVCRNLWAYLPQCAGYAVHRQVEHRMRYHRLLAISIVVFSAAHVLAHACNFSRFHSAHASFDALTSALTHLPATPNGTFVNPVRHASQDPVLFWFRSVAGLTGLGLTITLALIVTTSTHIIRRSFFELFWNTHRLVLVFYGLLVIHGTEGLLRSQTNVKDHDPSMCSAHPEDWGPRPGAVCAQFPQFASNSPQAWKWLIFPLILFLVERSVRLIRTLQTVNIVEVIRHPSSVMELRLNKDGFSFRPGQFIYLKCPHLSWLQWHPFTITSAPDDTYFSVHIRKAGDWTTAMLDTFASAPLPHSFSLYPRLAVDGPYGTGAERVFNYSTSILVGAGIGITPFASILQTFTHCSSNTLPRTLYLYWLCPEPHQFEWFAHLLDQLERRLLLVGRQDSFRYHLYLTRGWQEEEVVHFYARDADTRDVVSGLRQKTFFGRPNWKAELQQLADHRPREEKGLFYCGPKALARMLASNCTDHHIHFHQEHF